MAKRKKTKALLPSDPENMNETRTVWAERAIGTFIASTRTDREDALCDLLADLGHWCDRNGFDFNTELDRAIDHYRAETDGKGTQL